MDSRVSSFHCATRRARHLPRATGVAGAVEWDVNFADPRLFTAYGSELFAQDEMQVAEHLAFGAVRGRCMRAGGRR